MGNLVLDDLLTSFFVGVHLGQDHIDRMVALIQSAIQGDAFKAAAGWHQAGQEKLFSQFCIGEDGQKQIKNMRLR